MVIPSNALPALFVTWGVVTAVLLCVIVYRSTLSAHEEDQIFLNQSEESLAQEQRVLVARIQRLQRPIVALAVLSGVLLLLTGGLWLWQGYNSF